MSTPYYPRPDAELALETIAHYLDIAPDAIDRLWRSGAIKPIKMQWRVWMFRFGDVADAIKKQDNL